MRSLSMITPSMSKTTPLSRLVMACDESELGEQAHHRLGFRPTDYEGSTGSSQDFLVQR